MGNFFASKSKCASLQCGFILLLVPNVRGKCRLKIDVYVNLRTEMFETGVKASFPTKRHAQLRNDNNYVTAASLIRVNTVTNKSSNDQEVDKLITNWQAWFACKRKH